MELEQLRTELVNQLENVEEQFALADGADYNFRYLEGYAEALDSVLQLLGGE
jgi:hypothetical protein